MNRGLHECSFVYPFECFQNIAGTHAVETKENYSPRTAAATYRNGDGFRAANDPATDIYRNSGAADTTEKKGSYKSYRSITTLS